jgi:hypothetical protein
VLPALIAARNLWAGGDVSNRIPGIRNVACPYLTGAWKTMMSWAAPGASRIPTPSPASALAALAGALAIAALAAAAVVATRGGKTQPFVEPFEPRAPVLFAISIPLYTLLFFAAATFLDEILIPDPRLYAPLFPATVLASVFLLNRAVNRLRPGRLRRILGGLAVAYGMMYLLAGLAGLSLIRHNGRGLQGEYFRRPDVQAAVSYIRSRPSDLIFSNDSRKQRNPLPGLWD